MALYLRSPTTAPRLFGLDSPGEIFRSVPRTKFMFKAEFFTNPAAQNMINKNLNSSSDLSSIAFKVKQIDKPRITLNSQELNNYNKKRIVYTKVDYADAQIRMYDTVDNSVLNFWVNYFTYYFGDSRVKPSSDSYSNPIDAKFKDSTGWGLRPINEETNFFNKISVSAYFAHTVTTFSYINPKITGIDWQQKDYSSSDLEEATVTFKYEYIQYEKFGQPINEDTGFIPIDALDINQSITTRTSLLTAQPRMFSEQNQQTYVPLNNTFQLINGSSLTTITSDSIYRPTTPFPGINGRTPTF